jgi:hypothetical protein
MTRKKYCALLRSPVPSLLLHTPDQLSEVTGSRSPTGTVNRCRIRLLVCLVLLCAVAACGSQRDRAPIRTTAADAALTQAMLLENIPTSWNDSLRFIMDKESGGHVDIQNRSSSARGLFQLLAANYKLNPHGAASFGNGVEEAQGGIRYIKQRYGTADNAVVHWQQLHWY